MTDTLNLTSVVQALAEVAFMVISGLFLRYAPRIMAAVEDKLDLHLTNQQNAAILAAVAYVAL